MFPSLFLLCIVFRKSSEGELVESSYKLNLNLSVLLKVFNLTPDVRLKQLRSKEWKQLLLYVDCTVQFIHEFMLFFNSSTLNIEINVVSVSFRILSLSY